MRGRSPPGAEREPPPERPDYRLAGPAVGAWLTAAACVGISPARSLSAGLLLVVLSAVVARCRRYLAALVLAAVAVAALVGGLRVASTASGPVAALAQERAVVQLVLVLRSDPVVRPGRFGDFVVIRASVQQVTGRGTTSRVDSPVLVIADLAWSRLPLGARVSAVGALSPGTDTDVSAVFLPSRIEDVVSEPAWWWRASQVFRGGIAEGVATSGPDERALVPALVDGDDSGVSADLAADFRTCGLTHVDAAAASDVGRPASSHDLAGRDGDATVDGLQLRPPYPVTASYDQLERPVGGESGRRHAHRHASVPGQQHASHRG